MSIGEIAGKIQQERAPVPLETPLKASPLFVPRWVFFLTGFLLGIVAMSLYEDIRFPSRPLPAIHLQREDGNLSQSDVLSVDGFPPIFLGDLQELSMQLHEGIGFYVSPGWRISESGGRDVAAQGGNDGSR